MYLNVSSFVQCIRCGPILCDIDKASEGIIVHMMVTSDVIKAEMRSDGAYGVQSSTVRYYDSSTRTPNETGSVMMGAWTAQRAIKLDKALRATRVSCTVRCWPSLTCENRSSANSLSLLNITIFFHQASAVHPRGQLLSSKIGLRRTGYIHQIRSNRPQQESTATTVGN